MNTHATAASMMRAAHDELPCRLLTDGELAEIMPPQQYRCIQISSVQSRYRVWLYDSLIDGSVAALLMAGWVCGMLTVAVFL